MIRYGMPVHPTTSCEDAAHDPFAGECPRSCASGHLVKQPAPASRQMSSPPAVADGQRGSAGGVAFPDLGDEGLDHVLVTKDDIAEKALGKITVSD